MAVARRTTVADVARRAGVSPGLVSRVLRGQTGHASPETQRAIERAARDLGYAANALAQHLRTGRSAVVGVLFHRLATYHVYLPVVSGVEEVLRHAGYTPVLCSSDSPESDAAALRLFRSQQVAGVVAVSDLVRQPSAHLAAAVEDGLPLVAVNRWLDQDDADNPTGPDGMPLTRPGPVPRVLWDFAGGARTLASRLIALGHRRLAIVNELAPAHTASRVSTLQRIAAIRQTAREAGCPPPLEYRLDELPAGGWREAEVTGILALNDRTAANVLHTLAAHGVRVPYEVSVTGFTDSEVASHTTPRLTTARLPFEESGRLATRLLLDLVSGEAVPPLTIVPCPVIERESCAPAPAHVAHAGRGA